MQNLISTKQATADKKQDFIQKFVIKITSYSIFNYFRIEAELIDNIATMQWAKIDWMM